MNYYQLKVLCVCEKFAYVLSGAKFAWHFLHASIGVFIDLFLFHLHDSLFCDVNKIYSPASPGRHKKKIDERRKSSIMNNEKFMSERDELLEDARGRSERDFRLNVFIFLVEHSGVC
jgi:hypothetical protein